ncbi:uncharacterized protein LOC114433569 [Parambassis ranga]|uniref:Uncharacterized protein LOC114433569 n=1 Tax=Parambassis ranga TaxID=210632 RepID=A0A6P7I547_9TELE|nr:uncharacterized protein LOC114433569 [Parambassis ranga]
MAWLDSVNRERERRGASRLERCVLSAHGDVFRVPWEDLVYPQFVTQPRAAPKENQGSSAKNGKVQEEDTRLLPPPTTIDQSQVSSEAEDSEGEYVELMELPLPRFSPQKGSLTQSISLQHRARTSTHISTHTATHTASTHTHTSAAATHTPQISTAHSAAVTHTHSSPPSVEVSACTALCSRLMEENLNQDHSRSADLTAVSSSSSSSAPPQAVESISCLSGGPEGTNPCIEQRDGAEGEEQRKEEVTEEEQTEQMERRLNNVVSADRGKEEEEVQRVEGMCRSDEKVVEGEETDTDGDELEKEGAEEVEVEEEVQVIIMLPSPERKEEQLTTREKRGAQQAQLSDCNTLKLHCNDSYFEINPQDTNSGDFYSEKTPQTHPEACSEESVLHPEDFYSDKNKQAHLEDCTESTMLMHTVDSYFEEETLETHTEDCLQSSEGSQRPEDPYSEKDKPKTQMEDTLQTYTDQSYFEKDTQPACFRDSYFENTPSMHSEETLTLHTEGSYSEKESHKACLEDSYFENTSPVRPDDSLCEKESSGSNECEMPRSVSSVVPDPQGSDRVQEQKKGDEDEEEAAQTEGLSSSLTVSASPAEPAPPASAAPAVQVRLPRSSQCGFYSVLLRSGAVSLPGTTDRSRRPLLTVSTWNSVWSHPDCDSAELLRLLLYYISTLRKETRALGLTVLVDACRAAPAPALLSTLRSLQTDTPGSIHSVLILANKDSSLHVDRTAATQVELLSSLKALQKHVELHQLPTEFGGSFSFSQNSWLSFRTRVEQLTNQCEDVISLLQKTINILQSAALPAAAKDAELQLGRYRAVMHSILEDSRLVQLQQEGGASLSRLRREDGCEVTEEHRAAVETVSSLYDQVDELLHRLVTLSNSRTQELHFIVDFKSLEQGFSQVQTWLQEVGEVRLKSLEEPEDSLELLKHKQQDFKDFHTLAYENCKHGEALLARLERWDNVSTADLHVYEVKVHSFWAQLQDFSQRVNSTGKNIERAVRLYRFLDQVGRTA